MYHITSGGAPAVSIFPIFISAASRGQWSPQIVDNGKSYIGINMVSMFYLHKRPHNDVAPGDTAVGFTRCPCQVLPIPTSTPITPTPGEGGEKPIRWWEKTSHKKTTDPPLTTLSILAIRSHHAMSPTSATTPGTWCPGLNCPTASNATTPRSMISRHTHM